MAIYSSGNRVQITAKGLVQGNLYVNVFHYALNDNWDGQDLADAFETAWLDEIKAQQQQVLVYDTVELRDLDAPTIGEDIPISVTCTGTAELSPLTNAIVMKKKSEQIGRRFNGRAYIGCIQETQYSNGGDIASGTINAVVAAGENALTLTGPASETANMVIWSRVDLNSIDVATIQVNPTVATQRRRRKGAGA